MKKKTLRGTCLLIMIYVVLWAVIATFACIQNKALCEAYENSSEYEVQQGDTIWSITYLKYGDSVRMQDMVDIIERINGIESGYIEPGEIILLPER